MTAAHHHPAIVGNAPSTEQTYGSAFITWSDETATAAFAQRLAQCPALHNAYLTLHGDLGAGKTSFVRHLLHALGVQGRIKSPTYAVVEPHEAPSLSIWHFDFYRFDDPREWEDAGFRDLFASQGLKLAEWPDKAKGLAPQADLELHIEAIDESLRQVRLQAHTAAGQTLINHLLRTA